ncbi:hypothetical protein Tco_1569840, partial [Tanacetum coccineum]
MRRSSLRLSAIEDLIYATEFKIQEMVMLVALLQTVLPRGIEGSVPHATDFVRMFTPPENCKGSSSWDAFVGVDPRDVSVPVVGGQSVNGGGVTSADVCIGETDSAKPRESEQSFIVEVVDTIDCQPDLKQVSTPAYLTGIETCPQVSLLFHRKENISATISSFKSLQAHVTILERKKLSPYGQRKLFDMVSPSTTIMLMCIMWLVYAVKIGITRECHYTRMELLDNLDIKHVVVVVAATAVVAIF